MLSKTILQLTAALCLGSVSIAQANTLTCQALMKPLEDNVQMHGLTKANVEKDLKQAELDILSLEKQMGWGEKNLAGPLSKFFGGNSSLIDRRADLRKTRANLENQLETAKRNVAEADKAVVDAAIHWLKANDEAFAELQREADQICLVANAGRDCLQQIDNAIQAVSSAETDDLIGGMSDNKFIEYMAINDTKKANASTQNAKAEVQRYVQTLNELKHAATANHSVGGHNSLEETDTSTQFMFDFVFNSDFMDIMNYFNLSNTESQLRTIRGRVAEAHAKVEAAHRDLVAKIDQRACSLRESCRNAQVSQP